MPEPTLAVIEKIGTLLSKLGSVLGKLRAQPDPAATKLSEALDEITKTYLAVGQAITRFANLAYDEDGPKKGSQVLLELQNGALRTEVERSRGHCHEIGRIYDRYLDKWFEKALSKSDYMMTAGVFNNLREIDADLFVPLADVATRLENEAIALLPLLLAGKGADIRKRVLDTHEGLKPLQSSMNQQIRDIFGLKNEFLNMTV